MISSDPVSPIRPVGTNVTLNCTVELSPAPVTVNVSAEWTRPDGVILSLTTPVMVNSTRYTSTAIVSSFGRNQSGVYTCTAIVRSTSPFLTDSRSKSGKARVTVGKVNNCYDIVGLHTIRILWNTMLFIPRLTKRLWECSVLY